MFRHQLRLRVPPAPTSIMAWRTVEKSLRLTRTSRAAFREKHLGCGRGSLAVRSLLSLCLVLSCGYCGADSEFSILEEAQVLSEQMKKLSSHELGVFTMQVNIFNSLSVKVSLATASLGVSQNISKQTEMENSPSGTAKNTTVLSSKLLLGSVRFEVPVEHETIFTSAPQLQWLLMRSSLQETLQILKLLKDQQHILRNILFCI